MRGILIVAFGLLVPCVVMLWSAEQPPAGVGSGERGEAATMEAGARVEVEGFMERGSASGADEAQRSDVDAPALSGLRRVHGRLIRDGRPVGGVRICLRTRHTTVAEVQTGGDGRFVLEAKEAGRMRLEWLGPAATVVEDLLWVTVREDGDTDLGDVRMPAGFAARGRVVDEDGRALPTVRIYVGGGMLSYRSGLAYERYGRAATEVVAGPDGGFEVPQVEEGCRLNLRIEHPEFVALDVERRIAGSAVNLGTLTMQRGATLVGQVRSQSGAPIVGARVTPQREPRKFAVTGADGGYVLQGVGRDDFDCRAEGYAEQESTWLRRAAARLDFTLLACAQVEVTVDGAVEGDELLVSQSGRQSYDVRFESSGPGRTYRAEDLKPGQYEVRAWAYPRAASRTVTVDLAPGETRALSLSLTPFEPFSLSVVDEEGEPVPGVQVRCEIEDGQFRTGWKHRTGSDRRSVKVHARDVPALEVMCDELGRAELPLPDDCTLTFDVEAEGFEVYRQRVPRSRRGSERRRRIELQGIQRMGRVAVRIEPGPVSGVPTSVGIRDQALGARAAFTHFATVDTAGRCEGEIAPGTYAMRVGYSTPLGERSWLSDPASEQVVEVLAGEQAEVLLHAQAPSQVTVRVTDQGRPYTGALVSVHQRGQEPGGLAYFGPGAARTGANGEVSMVSMDPGVWEVDVRRAEDALPTTRQTLRLTAVRQSADLLFELGSATLRGRFDLSWVEGRLARLIEKDRDAYLQVYLFEPRRAAKDAFYMAHHGLPIVSRMRSATPDLDGEFVFENVPPGRWLLRIVTGLDDVQVQQIVDVPTQGLVDLGTVRRPVVLATSPTVTVRTGRNPTDGSSFGCWIRQTVDGVPPPGAFIQACPVADGPLTLQGLAPGAYTLELFKETSSAGWSHGIGITGRPVGKPVAIRVRSDGSVEPDEIRF